MPYQIATTANYHWVRKITASTHGQGALKLTMHGDADALPYQSNDADITIFTDDAAMVDRLIEAINSVSCAPSKQEAA